VLKGHSGDVYELDFTPDSRRLLSGSRDGTLRAWDMQTEQCVRIIRGFAISIYDLDIGKNSGSSGESLLLMRLKSRVG
jgi:WD40 repeat protein